MAVEGQGIAGVVAREQAMVGGAGVVDNQPAGVGVADQKIQIDAPGFEQFVNQGQDEEPVGAGADRHPFIGDRRIAGAHRIDRYEFGAARLYGAEAGLDRVGIVVLGDPEHQEVFGMLPIRLAKFPERPAN